MVGVVNVVSESGLCPTVPHQLAGDVQTGTTHTLEEFHAFAFVPMVKRVVVVSATRPSEC